MKKAQLHQRQNDIKEFIEFLESLYMESYNLRGLLPITWDKIQQKLTGLKQEINNGNTK